MKKLLSALAALCVTTALAAAAYLPLQTGPFEASQGIAYLNALRQQIISGVNGLIAVQPGAVSSTATTAEQTLATASIPANTLALAGQSVRLRCFGGTAANSQNKAVKLYFGTSSISTGTMSTSGETWDLELVVTYGASATSGVYGGRGSINTTVVAPVSGTTSDAMTSALTAKCTTTQGTASAADTVLYNFFVEQVK